MLQYVYVFTCSLKTHLLDCWLIARRQSLSGRKTKTHQKNTFSSSIVFVKHWHCNVFGIMVWECLGKRNGMFSKHATQQVSAAMHTLAINSRSAKPACLPACPPLDSEYDLNTHRTVTSFVEGRRNILSIKNQCGVSQKTGMPSHRTINLI